MPDCRKTSISIKELGRGSAAGSHCQSQGALLLILIFAVSMHYFLLIVSSFKNWGFYHTEGNHRWKQIFQVIFSNSFSRWKNWSEITDVFGVSSVTELVIEGRDHWQCISRLIPHTLFFPTTTQTEFYFYFCSEQKQPNWSYSSI